MTTYTTQTDRITLKAGTENEERLPTGASVTRAQLEEDGCQVDALVRAGLLKEAAPAKKAAAKGDG